MATISYIDVTCVYQVEAMTMGPPLDEVTLGLRPESVSPARAGTPDTLPLVVAPVEELGTDAACACSTLRQACA
jgi:hypothetical protein